MPSSSPAVRVLWTDNTNWLKITSGEGTKANHPGTKFPTDLMPPRGNSDMPVIKVSRTSDSTFIFFLTHRFHSISFTRAQGIPKYKIGFGKEKDGRVGERLVEGLIAYNKNADSNNNNKCTGCPKVHDGVGGKGGLGSMKCA